MHTTPIPVALAHCTAYTPNEIKAHVGTILDNSGFAPSCGSIVLVKPNLLRAEPLACTHPLVVWAACSWLLDRNVRIKIADSPGFGTPLTVAKHIGLDEALKPLGVSVEPMGKAVPLALSRGGTWPVAKLSLEADAILSIPKVKAHSQMGMTLAVKNLFGCIPGVAKAIAHTKQGHVPGAFVDGIVDLLRSLPPVAALADGVTAMHVKGPSGGNPFPLHCLAASASAVALDTALYNLVAAQPNEIPLWAALQEHNVQGAFQEQLCIVGDSLPVRSDFCRPSILLDISFRPWRLLVSVLRRWWFELRD